MICQDLYLLDCYDLADGGVKIQIDATLFPFPINCLAPI